MAASAHLRGNINLLNDLALEQDAVLGEDRVLTLSVELESTKMRTMMKFDIAMYVADCLKKIAAVERRDPEFTDYGDHGLYHISPVPTQCRWLDETKTLRYYDVHNLDEVHYRKKHRPLKVTILGGSQRTFMIDDSATVDELNEFIGRKIGVGNPEEYSLKKIDSTDNEWLHRHQTLHEQGILPDVELLFRKKITVTIDTDLDDKVSLNMAYHDIRTHVLDGVLPVTEDDAVLLAGVVCQIILGPHDPSRHKPALLNLAEFLPERYRRVKNIGKRILQSHSMLGRIDEHQAKFRYIQTARTVKTYGITFWKAKERIKNSSGKYTGKFREILLGVSRMAVHRVDPVTLEDIAESPHPFTHLRRHQAAKDTLWLDFGDYMDDIYGVLTPEADAIARYIEQTIDIILRLRRDRERKEEDDEQTAVIEDPIDPKHAEGHSTNNNTRKKIIEGRTPHPSVIDPPVHGKAGPKRPGVITTTDRYIKGDGVAPILSLDGASVTTQVLTQELERAQQELQAPRKDYDKIIGSMLDDLNDPDERKRLKNLQAARDMLNDLLVDLAGAAGDMISAAGVSDTKALRRDAVVDSARRITALSSQLNMAAALNGKISGDPNIDAAAADVNKKIGKLLQLANLAALDVDAGNGANFADLLACARDMGSAISVLAASGGVKTKISVEEASQKLLDASAAFLQSFKPELLPPVGATTIADAAKLARDAASQLAAASVLAGNTLIRPGVQTRLAEQARGVDERIVKVVALVNAAEGVEPTVRDPLLRAAELLSGALSGLTTSIKASAGSVDRSGEISAAAMELATVLESVADADSEAALGAAVKTAEKAGTRLGQLAALDADGEADDALRTDLLAAAREVARLVGGLVGGATAVRAAADDQAKAEEAEKVVATAAELGDASRRLAEQRRQKKTLAQLAQAAKRNSECVDALSQAVAHVKEHRDVTTVSRARATEAQATAANDQLYDDAQVYQAKPSAVAYQKALLSSAKAASSATSRLLSAARNCVDGCVVAAEGLDVKEAADAAGEALRALVDDLRAAQDACWALNAEDALERVRDAKQEVDSALARSRTVALTPSAANKPSTDAFTMAVNRAADYTSPRMAHDTLAMHAEAVAAQAQALSDAAANGSGEGVGAAAKQAADSTWQLAGAARAVAAYSTEREVQQATLTAAGHVTSAIGELVRASTHAVDHPSDPANPETIAAALLSVKALLGEVIVALPGQGDCARAANQIRQLARGMDLANLDPLEPGETLASFSDALLAASRALSVSLSKLVGAASGTPDELAAAAKRVEAIMATITDAVEGALAATAANPTAQSVIVVAAHEAFEAAALALDGARHVAANPDEVDAPKALAEQASQAQQAIEALGAALTEAAPGTGAVDVAVERIAAAVARLTAVLTIDPSRDLTQALTALMATTRALGETTTGLAEVARTEPGKVPASVDATATSLEAVVDAAVNSLSANRELSPHWVRLEQWQQLTERIGAGLAALPALVAGGEPKKMSKAVAQAVRLAQELSASITAEAAPTEGDAATLAAGSEQVKAATIELLKAAKSLGDSPQDSNGQQLVGTCGLVLHEAAAALTRTGCDVFGGGPNAQHATQMQRTLHEAARSVGTAVSSLVASSKVMMVRNKDVAAQSLLRASSKQAHEAIATLVKSAAEARPGQAECAEALERLHAGMAVLDEAVLAASVDQLRMPQGQTPESCRAGFVESMHGLHAALKAIGAGAKTGGRELAQAATQLGDGIEAFTTYARGKAAASKDPERRNAILEEAANVLSTSAALVDICRELGGESTTDIERTRPVSQAQKAVAAHLVSLFQTATNSPTDAPEFDETAVAVSEAVTAMLQKAPLPGMAYADYAEDITQRAKKLASSVVTLNAAAKQQPGEVDERVRDLTAVLPKLLLSIGGVADASSAGDDLLAAAQALADACRYLVAAAKEMVATPSDEARNKMTKLAGGDIAQALGSIMNLARAPAKGGREADEAATAIDTAISDLANAQLLVSTRLLKAEAGRSYAQLKDALSQSVLAVAGGAGKMIQGATGATTDLAVLIAAAATPLVELAARARDAAATLPDAGAQAQLLASVRGLGEILARTVEDTRAYNLKPEEKPLKQAVRFDARALTDAVTGLTALVDSLERVATQGKAAVDAVVATISAAMQEFESARPSPAAKAAPLELQEEAANTARAAAKVVLAAKAGQAETAQAAAELAPLVVALMERCKASVADQPVPVAQPLLQAAGSVAGLATQILQAISAAGGVTRDDRDAQKQVNAISRVMGEAVGSLVSQVELLRGGAGGEAGGDAAQSIEQELTAASTEINQHAARLLRIKPPTSANPQGGASMEEQAAEGCNALFAACAALVSAATAAQREIVKQGRATEGPRYQPEADWSAGLISAAQAVAGECKLLGKVATGICNGIEQRPAIVLRAAADGVTRETNHLTLAAQVKGDPNHETQRRLHRAATEVRQAVEAVKGVARNAMGPQSGGGAEATEGVATDGELESDYQRSQEMFQARIELLTCARIAANRAHHASSTKPPKNTPMNGCSC